MKRIPACGSIDPKHRSKACSACTRVYKGRDPYQGRLSPAACVFCGIAQRNSLGVHVIRYPLIRHFGRNGRHTSVCIGSMPMCDDCVMENAHLNERTKQWSKAA